MHFYSNARQWTFLAAIMALNAATLMRADKTGDWAGYLGDDARTHYSDLKQITTNNVHLLQPAWTYHSGDVEPASRNKIECNPLIVGGVLYGTSPLDSVFALDAAHGRELWRFNPPEDAEARHEPQTALGVQRVNRGVSYWTGDGEARVFFTYGHFMYALNAFTGLPVSSFGDHGRVDLKQDMGRDLSDILLASTTPGAIFEDLIIMPLLCMEGPGPSAPGYICAYNVKTGKRAWIFHTIPQPGEFGYDTWPPEAWKHVGGVNCWAGMAVDADRGLVFVPTGSPSYDFWGGNRHGTNLFSDCLICLDARTGRRRWHFQTVHHDLWDRDLPAPPTLLTVQRDGRQIPAVAQVTKSGLVFVFNRETGETLFPIEERPAPTSDLAGEKAWATQPVPLKPAPFTRQIITANDLTDRTPEVQRAALERFARMKQQVPFQPPSLQETIFVPGRDGGAEWGGAAVDRDGVLYINASDMAWVNPMVAVSSAGKAEAPGRATYMTYCAVCHGTDRAGNLAQNIPALRGIGTRMSRQDILARITEGRNVMPPFAFLPEKARRQLVDFLLELGRQTANVSRTRREQDIDPAEQMGPAIDGGGYYHVPYVSGGEGRWLDKDGYPNVKPPWGTLSAIDLNTGEYRWKVVLGEYPALIAQGLPPTGTDNYGGPIVTAGGLVFIGGTVDELIRAFDVKTGRELWRAKLPTGGYATPSTYMAGGKQYVVIAAGGGRLGSKSDDVYVAFALPETVRAVPAAVR